MHQGRPKKTYMTTPAAPESSMMRRGFNLNLRSRNKDAANKIAVGILTLNSAGCADPVSAIIRIVHADAAISPTEEARSPASTSVTPSMPLYLRNKK